MDHVGICILAITCAFVASQQFTTTDNLTTIAEELGISPFSALFSNFT